MIRNILSKEYLTDSQFINYNPESAEKFINIADAQKELGYLKNQEDWEIKLVVISIEN